MAIRRSYSAPAKSTEPTTFSGKYGLKNKAGLDEVNKDAYVIPLDMSNGYVEIPYHTVKKCADGTGFKNSRFNVKIACHKFDKNTGEVVDQLPLCCRLAQAEKDRITDKEKSNYRAVSFTARRNVIPVMVLSTTETDTSKKPSLKKVSIKNGIDFSFIDMSSIAYEEFTKDIQETMETEGIIDSPDDMDKEELAEAVAQYLQKSIIKVSNVPGRTKDIPYEKAYRAIPVSNQMVAKESGEQKLINCVMQVINDKYPSDKLPALFEKHSEIKAINNQVIDFLELFNVEVDNLVSDWTDDELQAYMDSYLEKQGVVNKYKSEKVVEEKVTFKEPVKATKAIAEDDDFEVPSTTSTATAVVEDDFELPSDEKSEESFDYSTSDLEESPILSDSDFSDDDFEMEDGDLL